MKLGMLVVLALGFIAAGSYYVRSTDKTTSGETVVEDTVENSMSASKHVSEIPL